MILSTVHNTHEKFVHQCIQEYMGTVTTTSFRLPFRLVSLAATEGKGLNSRRCQIHLKDISSVGLGKKTNHHPADGI